MSTGAQQLIGESLELASLPAVVTQALALIHRSDSSASDIGEVISQDPALSARLLKIVNSSFYGFPSRIETISRAITIVGTRELTDIILGSSAIQVFDRLPNALVDMESFWSHSLYSALLARQLARRTRARNTERYFVMALLHDLGSLLLYRHRPELAHAALQRAEAESLPVFEAERRVLGFDHAELGAELMRAWRLPDSFAAIAAWHHRPASAGNFVLEATIVHLADVVAISVHGSADAAHRGNPLEAGAWERTGLSPEAVEPLSAAADQQFEDARAALLPRYMAA